MALTVKCMGGGGPCSSLLWFRKYGSLLDCPGEKLSQGEPHVYVLCIVYKYIYV